MPVAWTGQPPISSLPCSSPACSLSCAPLSQRPPTSPLLLSCALPPARLQSELSYTKAELSRSSQEAQRLHGELATATATGAADNCPLVVGM